MTLGDIMISCISYDINQAIIWISAEILLIRNTLQWNINRSSNIWIEKNSFENIVCKMVVC